jgi:hypothetical protein
MHTDFSRVRLANDAAFVNSVLPDMVLLRTMASLLIDADLRMALNFAIPTGLAAVVTAPFDFAECPAL